MKKNDEVCRIAYELYEKSGKVDGRDFENWLEAEKIVMSGQPGKGKILMGAAGDMPKTVLSGPKNNKAKKQLHAGRHM